MSFQICRVCYQRGYDLMCLKDEVNNYEQKLSSCIPEIDIYVIHNPGICRKCADMLDVAFQFRNICLENEKRYNDTFVENNRKSTMQIIIKKETDAGENNDRINTNYDSPDLLTVLEVQTESKHFCSVCNKDFPSHHDKKLHDFKLHRQLKHRILKNSLSPSIEHLNSAKQSTSVQTTESSNMNVQDISDSETESAPSTNNSLNDATLKCAECNITFINNDDLNKHQEKHLKRSCHICMKTFDEEGDLDSHVKLHFIKCCGESFSTASLLKLHTYNEHYLMCGICNEKYTEVTALFNHVLDHVGIHWYKCNFCGKQFNTRVGLDEHNCQYYMCHVCGTIYFTIKAFDEHLKIHQTDREFRGDVGNQNFHCVSCSKCYQTQALLMEHTIREHSVSASQTNSSLFASQRNSFSCYLCGNVYHLHIHLKTHILQIHCNKILTIPVADCRKNNFYTTHECLRKSFSMLSKYLMMSSHALFLPRNVNLRRRFDILSQYLNCKARASISSYSLIARCIKICFVCKVMYMSYKSLCAHVKARHPSCCWIKFKTISDFFEHNVTHYDEVDKVGGQDEIMCMRCTTKYKNYIALLTHTCIWYRHKLTNAPSLKRKDHLSLENAEDIEMETNTNTQCTIEIPEIDQSEDVSCDNDGNSKEFMCVMCKEYFDSKPELKAHANIHI